MLKIFLFYLISTIIIIVWKKIKTEKFQFFNNKTTPYGSMTVGKCVEIILQTFPECSSLYQTHIDDFGEVLLHIFAAETISEPMIERIQRHSDVKIYCEMIESMWKYGDEQVQNVVDVTILERLSDDKNVWQQFGKEISAEFRNYINNDLLASNAMMSGVDKLV